MSELLLAVDELHTGYDATEVLRGVSFAIQPGEVVAVLGSNGAGKSTTLRAISGLVAWIGYALGLGTAVLTLSQTGPGGDVLVPGNGVVIIGMSERTSRQAITQGLAINGANDSIAVARVANAARRPGTVVIE